MKHGRRRRRRCCCIAKIHIFRSVRIFFLTHLQPHAHKRSCILKRVTLYRPTVFRRRPTSYLRLSSTSRLPLTGEFLFFIFLSRARWSSESHHISGVSMLATRVPSLPYPAYPNPVLSCRRSLRHTRLRRFRRERRVDALGFALIRHKTEGLKHEYRGMSGKEIGALK